jgi:DNA-binding winged helix-turn-helix (wHTH) protein
MPRLRFGDCLFDSETREVSRKGHPRALSLKAFRLLEVLLERRPRAVSKAELHEVLWPETYVSESSLARLVAELRACLGDDARSPHLVRTVHGFGYAFSGEAVEAPRSHRAGERPACRLLWGERVIPLPEGEHLVGRDDEAVVCVVSPKVSRRHARFVVTRDGATIEDLGSRNGTFVRGERIEGARRLADGDEILIGPVLLRFRSGSGRSTETEAGS